ncbi:hypothetical protein, conserved [Eimeria maxima]|uniref:Transmembrane protein n=1 Tax=Eimeria maxima TaxID=5804 RepID=U6MC80_EIMMA|nr:hypothetical protein, conserved [Eimeria maxima]CDJ60044.1 hypothetical protein, conserved [Eimeria maxima]
MDLALIPLHELPSLETRGSVELWRSFPGNTAAPEQLNIGASRRFTGRSGDIPTGRHLKRVKFTVASSWVILAVLVGVSLLFVSLCGSARKIHRGAEQRRLAGNSGSKDSSSPTNPHFSEDDWIPLNADELANLCAQVGDWAPGFVPHSYLSPSVGMPEVPSTSKEPSEFSGVLRNEQQPHEAISKQHKGKRTRQGGYDILGESPNKVGRLSHHLSSETGALTEGRTLQGLTGGAQQTSGIRLTNSNVGLLSNVHTLIVHQEGLGTPLVDLRAVQQTRIVDQEGEHSSPTTRPDSSSAPKGTLYCFGDCKQASVSQSVLVPLLRSDPFGKQGHSSQTSGKSLASKALTKLLLPVVHKHPFVRQPVFMPNVKIEDIEVKVPQAWIADEPIAHVLRTIRRLCLKPALNHEDANELIHASITLAQRALSSMTTPVDLRASIAVAALGRRFLVFNAVYPAFKLMKGKKYALKKLWADLVDKVPTVYDRAPRGMTNAKHKFHHQLAEQLSDALEVYKSGSQPSEKKILDLKRKLFCHEFSPTCFLRESWNQWREDDEQHKD